MSWTHKLHAIFTERSNAQSARDLMMKSGLFRRNQVLIVEVPSLVDTENASAHNRARRLPEFLQPPRVAALAGGIVLAVAVSYSLFDVARLDSKSLSIMIVSATIGAFVGMLAGWIAHTARYVSAKTPELDGKNWVLVAHTDSQRQAEFAEELLTAARHSSKFGVRCRGDVVRYKRSSWSGVSG